MISLTELEPHKHVLFFSHFLLLWWNRYPNAINKCLSLEWLRHPSFFFFGKYLLTVFAKTQEITYNSTESARNILWSASLFWNLASVLKLEIESQKKKKKRKVGSLHTDELIRTKFCCLSAEAVGSLSPQHSWWKALIWWWSQVSRRLLSLLPTRPSN